MAAGGRVEGRDADQAVDARLGLQPAVGVRAADLVGGRADAGLLARAFGDELDLHALGLGPADVHAGEHRGPVAALGAPCPGVDLEEGVVSVRLAVEERFGLALRRLVAQRADRRLGVGDDGVVALGLAELDELALVGELAGERLHAVQRVGEGLAVAHQLLGAGGVGPERRVLGHGVELLEPVLGGVPADALAQELERLLDLFGEAFGLGAHGSLRGRAGF